MQKQIKIYIVCHKPAHVPSHPFLFPVQAGASLTEKQFPGMIPDNTGEHISNQNPFYCELTVQYWAWKNDIAEWQGLFHYRRYLDFRCFYSMETQVQPYRIANLPTDQILRQSGYEPEYLLDALGSYDAIVPIPEEMGMTVAEHYASAPNHFVEDLRLILEILRRSYPQMYPAAEDYVNGTKSYFGNLFLMRREIFERYSAWLFSVLEQYDIMQSIEGCASQKYRVDGYLAERLFGMFFADLQTQKHPIAYVPRIHFAGMEGIWPYWKKKTECFFFPPGSTQRCAVRKLLRSI